MIIGGSGNLINLITSTSADIDVQASWTDKNSSNFNSGPKNTQITAATTTTIVPTPASGDIRSLVSMKIFNINATGTNVLTVQHFDGTTTSRCWKGALEAGESVEYDGKIFNFYNSNGYPVIISSGTTGPSGPQGDIGPSGATGPQGAAGGGDWTSAILSSDFTTNSATAVDVTGLSFTPSTNKQYMIRGVFYLQTATTTVGPRPGLTWPTNLVDGVAQFSTTSSATTALTTNGNNNAAMLVAVGGLPVANSSYPGFLDASIITDGTTTGNFQVQLATETAGTNVKMKTGSFISWREIS